MDEAERKRREAIVISDHNGIIPYAEVFYIISIIYAAEACLVAYARYEYECARGQDDAAAASAMHEALGHAAGLSRFFWPPSQKRIAHARAEKLRQTYSLDADSPLRARGLRNALEHYDERLDEFLLGDVVGGILPEPLIGDVSLADDETGHIFKLLDPEHEILVVLGAKFEFAPIIEEVGRILDRSYDLDGGSRRLRHPQSAK